ncbi:MAG: GNAT family N-acetyltransferase [Kofleriaceae bacterium]
MFSHLACAQRPLELGPRFGGLHSDEVMTSITPLPAEELAAATALLASACRFERAAEVAEEKLFGDGPDGPPIPLAARWEQRLVGVACVGGDRVRVLAVAPAARRRGVGQALLEACEQQARAAGATALHVLDQPGNYLAPGVDERDLDTRGWLTRRGFVAGEPRHNLVVELRGNPKVTAARAEELAAAASQRGYQLRRAGPSEPALLAAIDDEFGGAWSFEVARALEAEPPGVHLAERDGAPCAFAAHDGNNRGLGWFGPAGTWPAHRGQGLGQALLLACLVDVARAAVRTEIAWVGPEGFYEASCGVAGRRIFRPMKKALS